ncbi:(deoxy)nucleoside triphosphate pyrophosphohydrolase [Pseudonocardia saturnea]
MPVLRSTTTTTIAAPPRTVAGALRDADVLRRCGFRIEAPTRWLAAGDEVRIMVGHAPPTLRIDTVSAGGMAASGGAFALVVTLTAEGDGTRMVDELRWAVEPGPAVRALADRVLAARAAEIAAAAGALAAAPAVVATALFRGHAVLAAQRTRPPALAGRWELPGGRVEPGESEAAAVVRECREELGTDVVVAGRLGTDLRIDVGVLRVHVARLAAGAPDPRALEHSGLRWVTAAEVPALDWVDADRAVVADLVDRLGP